MAKTTEKTAAAEQKVEKQAEAPTLKPTDRVKIKLFKGSGKYSGDETVIVNGKSYKIQRGVEVEVPLSVYEVLQNSMEQDIATANMIERESSIVRNYTEA